MDGRGALLSLPFPPPPPPLSWWLFSCSGWGAAVMEERVPAGCLGLWGTGGQGVG